MTDSDIRASVLNDRYIIVVDDELDTLDLLSFVLEEEGAIVSVATSAQDARQQISQQLPSLLVCDIGMPHEDGYSFIEGLRQEGYTFPAIALTAYAKLEDRDRALQAGFQRHVTKPVAPDDLVDTIIKLLVSPP